MLVFLQCKKEEKKNEQVFAEDLVVTLGPKGKPVLDTFAVPEHLKDIVKTISYNNIYETEVRPKGDDELPFYSEFLKLKSKASEKALLQLTNNKNKVVAVYASTALIERNPKFAECTFQKFVNTKDSVYIMNGCLVGYENASDEIYWSYYYRLKPEQFAKDKTLQKLDSLTIYSKNSSELLLSTALKNRRYPIPFNRRIQQLAFTEKRIPAMFYLSNWYKGIYSEKLQKEFKNVYLTDTIYTGRKLVYFTELLSFKNPANKAFILQCLKEDSTLTDEFTVSSQLESNGVFPHEH